MYPAVGVSRPAHNEILCRAIRAHKACSRRPVRLGLMRSELNDLILIEWVFRSIVPTDSGPSCPAIPVHRAHPFRSIVPSLTG